MILDSPVAVSDEDNSGKEYETIVILELKRPIYWIGTIYCKGVG